MFGLILTEKQKRAVGKGLLALSVTPQILFAIGAVWPPAAAAAVAVQSFLSLFETIQPGLVQGSLAYAGAKTLSTSQPEPKK